MKKILLSTLLLASISAVASPATNDVQYSISSPSETSHFQHSNSSLTREQVKSDLVQAQKDGTLQSIKSWGRGGH